MQSLDLTKKERSFKVAGHRKYKETDNINSEQASLK